MVKAFWFCGQVHCWMKASGLPRPCVARNDESGCHREATGRGDPALFQKGFRVLRSRHSGFMVKAFWIYGQGILVLRPSALLDEGVWIAAPLRGSQ